MKSEFGLIKNCGLMNPLAKFVLVPMLKNYVSVPASDRLVDW